MGSLRATSGLRASENPTCWWALSQTGKDPDPWSSSLLFTHHSLGRSSSPPPPRGEFPESEKIADLFLQSRRGQGAPSFTKEEWVPNTATPPEALSPGHVQSGWTAECPLTQDHLGAPGHGISFHLALGRRHPCWLAVRDSAVHCFTILTQCPLQPSVCHVGCAHGTPWVSMASSCSKD